MTGTGEQCFSDLEIASAVSWAVEKLRIAEMAKKNQYRIAMLRILIYAATRQHRKLDGQNELMCVDCHNRIGIVAPFCPQCADARNWEEERKRPRRKEDGHGDELQECSGVSDAGCDELRKVSAFMGDSDL